MINSGIIDQYLEKEFAQTTSSVMRDLSLNFKKILEDSPLEPNERMMNLAAIATSLHDHEMQSLAKSHLVEMGMTPEQVSECFEVAGIMGMLNTYYKFKGFLAPENIEANYARAGLRMQSLGKPQNGKVNFEMMALAVSVVNGCPACVSNHEKALVHSGMSYDKIHDVAKLASVCKGLNSLKAALNI